MPVASLVYLASMPSCMDARVKLLGLEYAWWSLAMFFVLGALALGTMVSLMRVRTS